MKKYSHITDTDRVAIEHSLKEGMPLKRIAGRIGKHHSTVAREIRARSVASDKGACGRITNRCAERRACQKIQLCMDKPDCTRRCAACSRCNTLCPDFLEETCAKLGAAPYVCNGCSDERDCVLRKRYYIHSPAHKHYRKLLVKSREGANITQDGLPALDALVSPLVRRGQSVHHIPANNPSLFDVHEKTVYRYIAGGLLSAKNGDMPHVCMIKPRRRKSVEHKVDTKCRLGRTYADFKAFMEENPGTPAVEMDTVTGRAGGKCLLTPQFVGTGFMPAFLRGRNDAQSVIDAFAHLWALAGAQPFRRLFPVLLTDNGSEFSNPLALELAPDATRPERGCSTATHAPHGRRHTSSVTTNSCASYGPRARASTA